MTSAGPAQADCGTPLEAHIKELIRADGPLRLDRYMELCLAHPEHGYYMGRDPLGRAGDFITAPEVSQMFGELIGVWCVDAWDAMGQPGELAIMELGPGRGTLMSDVLRCLGAIAGFTAKVRVHLVETSPALRQRQRETLTGSGASISWHEAVDQMPAGPAIVLANEFFDALGVRQFEHRSGAWFERMIGLDGAERLALGLAPDAIDLAATGAPAAGEGDIWEFAPTRLDVARALGGRAQGGACAGLIIDYGHAESGLGDTVQAVRAHQPVDIVHAPGDADLTSHVDFAALGGALQEAGATTFAPITQGTFLTALGIEARAEVLKTNGTPEQRADVDAALARLTHCDQMGNLFKVSAFTSPGMRAPYPFGEFEA